MGIGNTRFAGGLLAVGMAVAISMQIGVFASELQKPSKDIRDLSRRLDTFWEEKFRRAGIAYRAPTRILSHTKPLSTACGRIPMGDSFYCPDDASIYLDNRYHARLATEIGEYGSGILVAHEWAHHIQTLLGWPWAERNLRVYDGAALELHADCLAGISSGSALNNGVLNKRDLAEAQEWMLNHGDNNHGSGFLRRAWFKFGVRTQRVAKCASVYSFRERGTIPSPRSAAA